MEGVCECAPCQNPPGRTPWKGLAVVFGRRPHGLRASGVLTPGSSFLAVPRQETGSSSLSPAPVLCGQWGLLLGERVISLLTSFLWSRQERTDLFPSPGDGGAQVMSGQSPRS